MPSSDHDAESSDKDAELARLLHGNSLESQGLAAMSKKEFSIHNTVLTQYYRYFGKDIIEDEKMGKESIRQGEYSTMVNLFYNIATDFYEYGWCRSLHFCRFGYKEPFLQSIARHEHYLAHKIGIHEGMTVLDAGSGLGGPAMEIAKFTDAQIIGINSSDYQIQKATNYAKRQGLSKNVNFVKGDFTKMQFPDNIFDAAYAIEATLHSPKLENVYGEIFRVLKPGSIFGVYEWLLTEKYDSQVQEHRSIALGIQQANGIPKLFTVPEGLAAMRAVGFDIMHHEDLADRPAAAPWYHPLVNSISNTQSLWDCITFAPMSPWGRKVTHYLTGSLETIGVLPRGTQLLHDSLCLAADCLVTGGQRKLFTPMYFILARKPEA